MLGEWAQGIMCMPFITWTNCDGRGNYQELTISKKIKILFKKLDSPTRSWIYFSLDTATKMHWFVIERSWSRTHDRFLKTDTRHYSVCWTLEQKQGRGHGICAGCSLSSKILHTHYIIISTQAEAMLTSLSLGDGEPSWLNGAVWLLRRLPEPTC